MASTPPARKRLITERDVASIAAGGRLVVDDATLVTPAARDAAAVRGIPIVTALQAARAKDGCDCAPCRAGARCACEGPWPPLADGDYLIQVRSGVVRARRVEP
jgi:hypothetical protein